MNQILLDFLDLSGGYIAYWNICTFVMLLGAWGEYSPEVVVEWSCYKNDQRVSHCSTHTHIYREPRLDVRGIQDSLKENISPCWWLLSSFKIPPWLLFYQDPGSFQITCTWSFFSNYISRPTTVNKAICLCRPGEVRTSEDWHQPESSLTHIIGDYVISLRWVFQIGCVYYQSWLKLRQELISRSTNGNIFAGKGKYQDAPTRNPHVVYKFHLCFPKRKLSSPIQYLFYWLLCAACYVTSILSDSLQPHEL